MQSFQFRLAWVTLILVAISPAALAQGNPAPGFRLYGPLGGSDTFLTDTNGNVVQTWPSSFNAGIAVYLEPDGTLLRSIRTGSLPGAGGGAGGGIQRVALDGSVLWEFHYDTGGPAQSPRHRVAAERQRAHDRLGIDVFGAGHRRGPQPPRSSVTTASGRTTSSRCNRPDPRPERSSGSGTSSIT